MNDNLLEIRRQTGPASEAENALEQAEKVKLQQDATDFAEAKIGVPRKLSSESERFALADQTTKKLGINPTVEEIATDSKSTDVVEQLTAALEQKVQDTSTREALTELISGAREKTSKEEISFDDAAKLVAKITDPST